MTFLLNGKVGIGTTNPGYKLTVISDSTAALNVQASSATVGSPIVDFYDNGRNQETIITSTDGSTTGTYIASYSNHPLMFGAYVGNSPTAKMTIATSGNIGMGEGDSSIARLNVNGSTKMNRSFYNWYQGSWSGNSTYWHMKTSMWGGGSPSGNIQYTMSLFKGYSYSYGDSAVREGMYGFHNWVGIIYNPSASGNLFSNVYVSSDGYVVLVIPSGSGETGVTIDWHQAYGYPFAEAYVTAAKLYGATTGGY